MMLLSPPEEYPENEKIRNKDFTHYDEGVYVGYRHFDKVNMEVAYPFGFGLSYTSFEYGELASVIENDTIKLSLTIRNMGDVAGKEVVQVYTEKLNSTIDRPVQELKAFAKTQTLVPGESQELQFAVPVAELSYWDEDKKGWALEKSVYQVKVGSSSRDIRVFSKEFTLP